MSYIYNNEIKYSDSPNLDAFGRLRTSNITSLLEYKHTFHKLPLVICEATGGTITSTFDHLNSQVVMTTSANNSYVIRQGKTVAIYQPGKSQLVEATFGNFQIEANVIKRVGAFSTTTVAPYNSVLDGFVLESNGITNQISFQIWQSGTTTFSAATTSWLTDDYDVTNIDWSKGQLMMIDYQWLGIGRVRFSLFIDGVPRKFVAYSAGNNINHVYMSNPNQPIRYEIRQLGAGSGQFNMICSQVSMEGSINSTQRTLGLMAFNTQNLATAGIKYPLVGYRIGSDLENVTIILDQIQSINATTPSKSDYYLTVEFNPTLSITPSFSGVTLTPIEYALGGGATVTTSGFVLATFLGTGGAAQVDSVNFKDNMIRPGVNIDGTRDEIWICASSVGNNQVFRSAINLSYFL